MALCPLRFKSGEGIAALQNVAVLDSSDRDWRSPESVHWQDANATSQPCATIPAMLDIRLIREQPDLVKERLATRGAGGADTVDAVMAVDIARRKAETAVQQLNGERRRLSKEIGGRRGRGEDAPELENQGREIGDKIARLNEDAAALDDLRWHYLDQYV